MKGDIPKSNKTNVIPREQNFQQKPTNSNQANLNILESPRVLLDPQKFFEHHFLDQLNMNQVEDCDQNINKNIGIPLPSGSTTSISQTQNGENISPNKSLQNQNNNHSDQIICYSSSDQLVIHSSQNEPDEESQLKNSYLFITPEKQNHQQNATGSLKPNRNQTNSFSIEEKDKIKPKELSPFSNTTTNNNNIQLKQQQGVTIQNIFNRFSSEPQLVKYRKTTPQINKSSQISEKDLKIINNNCNNNGTVELKRELQQPLLKQSVQLENQIEGQIIQQSPIKCSSRATLKSEFKTQQKIGKITDYLGKEKSVNNQNNQLQVSSFQVQSKTNSSQNKLLSNKNTTTNNNNNNNNNVESTLCKSLEPYDNQAFLKRQLREKESQLETRQRIIEQLQQQVYVLQQSQATTTVPIHPNPTANRLEQTATSKQPVGGDLRKKRIRSFVRKQCLISAERHRRINQMELSKVKQRLGEYAMDPVTFKDQWVYGKDYLELIQQNDQLENRITRLQNELQFLSVRSIQSIKCKSRSVAQTNSNISKQQQPILNFAESVQQIEPLAARTSVASSNRGGAPSNRLIFQGVEQYITSSELNFAKSIREFIEDNKNVSEIGSDDEVEEEGQDEQSDLDLTNRDSLSVDERKRKIRFQISIHKQKLALLNTNIEHMKKEIKENYKRSQLQYLEENSRFGSSAADTKWPVLGKKYQLLSLIGKGGFSEVYKAVDLVEFREVAIKIHNIDQSWTQSTRQAYLKHALREHAIQKDLDHMSIVALYGFVQIDAYSFATVQQLCDGPDLSHYLKMHLHLDQADAKYIVKQVLEGLKYLDTRANRIIHYDLKPQNILFHRGSVKITDFGLSKVMEDQAARIELTSFGVGTYYYLPPECFSETTTISNKVDIWSVGIILFEIIFGQRPFGHKMSQQQILQQKVILNSHEVIFPSTPAISKECQSFILGCLQYHQENRFDVHQALAHPYFKRL